MPPFRNLSLQKLMVRSTWLELRTSGWMIRSWSMAFVRPKTSTGRLLLCSEMVLLKLKLKLMPTLILKLEASLELALGGGAARSFVGAPSFFRP